MSNKRTGYPRLKHNIQVKNMAFMDDPEFIIAHIRHSCVITDDTGKQFCKIVLRCSHII